MEINFCDGCDNLMGIYTDDEKSTLYLGCSYCGNKKDYNETNCVYDNQVTIDRTELLVDNKHLVNDITIPTIQDNVTLKCPNELCISNKEKKQTEIMYIKSEEKTMKYLYICKGCGSSWTNK